MSPRSYDAIVVGTRCAGAPTAMLLARKGYKVLALDKATFPSDTISTHLIHPPGVSALKRWGLLDRLVATGCPAVETYSFDFGPFTITGRPGTDESPVAYAPRRTVLDKILVDAASEAGVEVRQEFTVESLLTEGGRVTGIRGHRGGGSSVEERAPVVIGADGRGSIVAKSTNPDVYHEKPPIFVAYYTYWSGLPMNGRFEAYIRPGRSFAVWPTNDDRTLVIAGWPYAELDANKKDIEGNYHKVIDMAPEFAVRLKSAKREDRFVGTAVPNYFRKPFGPGWALIGDAGYNRDFITAFGIMDAFHQAELCTKALDESFSGARSYDVAMGDYQSARDERALPMYEMTCKLAAVDQPPPPEMQQLLAAVHGNPESMDAFARLNAGVISPPEFFSGENLGRIFASAKQATH
jgi:2-polyprenyl-6-methoxyphenol hydroxylase-like FAD-dependent oxidoreductase